MLNEQEKKKLEQRIPSALKEATIQDPPLDDDGMLRVEIDAERGAIHHCPWQKPPASEPQPEPEDAAAVMESDGGNYWVVGWWSNA